MIARADAWLLPLDSWLVFVSVIAICFRVAFRIARRLDRKDPRWR